MTVIAWDGTTLAADRRITRGSSDWVCASTRKITKLLTGELIGAAGTQSFCNMVRAWYVAGADPDTFPEGSEDKYCDLLVIRKSPLGYETKIYNSGPYPIEWLPVSRGVAIGSGAQAAMVAMHCGKSAREAVEIASMFDPGCGNGIDELTL